MVRASDARETLRHAMVVDGPSPYTPRAPVCDEKRTPA